MTPEAGGRRCARCDRHIFDYSLLTEAQTVQLKVLSGGSVCRKVHLDAAGAPIFAERAVRRIVRTAAGVVLSVAMAGCEPEPAPALPEPARVALPATEPLAPDAPAPEPMAPLAPRDQTHERAAEGAAPETERAAMEEAERRALEAAPEAPRPRRKRRRPRPVSSHESDPLVGLDGL